MNNVQEVLFLIKKFIGNEFKVVLNHSGFFSFEEKESKYASLGRRDATTQELADAILDNKNLDNIFSEGFNTINKWNKFIIKEVLSQSQTKDLDKLSSLLMIGNYGESIKEYLKLVEEVKAHSDEKTSIDFFKKLPRKIGSLSYIRQNEVMTILKNIELTFPTNTDDRILDFLLLKSKKGVVNSVAVRDSLITYYGMNDNKLEKFKDVIPLLKNMELNIEDTLVDEDIFFEKNDIKKVTAIVNLEKVNAVLKLPQWKDENYALLIESLLKGYKKDNEYIQNIVSNTCRLGKNKCLYINILTKDQSYTKEKLNKMISSFLKEINSVTLTGTGLEESFVKKWLEKYKLEVLLPETTVHRKVSKL